MIIFKREPKFYNMDSELLVYPLEKKRKRTTWKNSFDMNISETSGLMGIGLVID